LRGVSATRIKASDQVIRDARSAKFVSVPNAKKLPASAKVERTRFISAFQQPQSMSRF
jgi:hypothetical protein